MKYAINKLKNLLKKLDVAYCEIVFTGKIEETDSSAIENRNKAKELEKAIKILENNDKP